MILDKAMGKELDDRILEWELAGEEVGGDVKQVSIILKKLLSVLKTSDKMNLDEISAILIFFINAIHNGQDCVLDLCDHLYDDYLGIKRLPAIGYTNMTNPDGTYVSLAELGIDT